MQSESEAELVNYCNISIPVLPPGEVDDAEHKYTEILKFYDYFRYKLYADRHEKNDQWIIVEGVAAPDWHELWGYTFNIINDPVHDVLCFESTIDKSALMEMYIESDMIYMSIFDDAAERGNVARYQVYFRWRDRFGMADGGMGNLQSVDTPAVYIYYYFPEPEA